MKIALKIRAKNGILQKFIDEKGWTQSDFARSIGVHPTEAGRYFNFKSIPGPVAMLKICELVGKTPEEIFPEMLRDKEFLRIIPGDKTIYRNVAADRIISLNECKALPYHNNPENELTMKQTIDILKEALTTREKEIIDRWFGLNGPEESLKEIAQDKGLTRSRVQQIAWKALRKLQNKGRAAT